MYGRTNKVKRLFKQFAPQSILIRGKEENLCTTKIKIFNTYNYNKSQLIKQKEDP